MTPEFSRRQRIETIGAADGHITIDADDAERRALSARFGLVSIKRLVAAFAVRREADAIRVTGRVEAAVVQACTVTGEPLTVRIDEPMVMRFVEALGGDKDLELQADALDTVEIDGDAIDLGEAAAETLALALDPFLRGPNAAAALRAAGVIGEDEAAPLGALAGLKALLANR